MPQYDVYEDLRPMVSPLHPTAEQIPPSSPLNCFPVNKPLTACHDEGINKPSDTDTPEIDEASPPSSPCRFHRRRSLLSWQEAPTIESLNFSESSTTPMKSSQAEKDHLAVIERSQQQDDAIGRNLQCDEQEAKETARKHRVDVWNIKDAEIVVNEERDMIKGG